jgi:hypothetical protein
VYFYLRDGSYVRSGADHHYPLEGAYQVSGDLWKDGTKPRSFYGVLESYDIEKTVIFEFHGGRTALAGGLAFGIPARCLLLFRLTGLILVVIFSTFIRRTQVLMR